MKCFNLNCENICKCTLSLHRMWYCRMVRNILKYTLTYFDEKASERDFIGDQFTFSDLTIFTMERYRYFEFLSNINHLK